MDFLHPFARFEILPLTEDGDGCQEAELGVVHLHFDHATAEAKQGLGPEAGLLVVLFGERVVVGENDRVRLRIVSVIVTRCVIDFDLN